MKPDTILREDVIKQNTGTVCNDGTLRMISHIESVYELNNIKQAVCESLKTRIYKGVNPSECTEQTALCRSEFTGNVFTSAFDDINIERVTVQLIQ